MLGTAKNAIVVWIGIVFLGDTVTGLQGGGYAMSLAGFFLYNYLKLQNSSTGMRPPAPRVLRPGRPPPSVLPWHARNVIYLPACPSSTGWRTDGERMGGCLACRRERD